MKSLFERKGLIAGILAVVIALTMGIFALASGGQASPLSNALNFVIAPVQGALEQLRLNAEQRRAYSDLLVQYEEENEQLKLRIAEMEEQARASEAANRENERLRELLGLREKRRDFVFEPASVVTRDLSNWASTLTVAEGSNKGIEPGQCVVDQYGNLVGFVSETGTNWAEITTVIDTDMAAGATVFRTGLAAVAEGDFSLMQDGLFKLSYIPRDEDLQIGDVVLTSGAGGKYPKDLVIGYISGVFTEKTGMSEYASVSPAARLDTLEQVFVITSFEIED